MLLPAPGLSNDLRGSAGSPPLYRVILAASIGNTLEWFDFLIYGYFAVTISKLFFPTGNVEKHRHPPGEALRLPDASERTVRIGVEARRGLRIVEVGEGLGRDNGRRRPPD